MTPNLPDRIGSNAGAAAEAARLRAAADAAIRRAAFAPATANTDRDDHRTAVRSDRAASRVPAVGEVESHREDRVRSDSRPLRRGPNPLFVAQLIAQLTDQDSEASDPVRTTAARGAAAYPSLSFDNDILLPGDDVFFAATAHRLDIRV